MIVLIIIHNILFILTPKFWLFCEFTKQNDCDIILLLFREGGEYMDEETNVSQAVAEIKNANEEELRKVIEHWFEATHNDGLKIGAQLISAAVYAAIQKNLNKEGKTTMNDYKRAIKEITKIIQVQLTKQSDSEKEKE